MYEMCDAQLVRDRLHANYGLEEKRGLNPMNRWFLQG